MNPTTKYPMTLSKLAELGVTTGWLAFTLRLTFADVMRVTRRALPRYRWVTFWQQFGAWIGGLVITNNQLRFNLGLWRSGRHKLNHVATVIVRNIDLLCLFESRTKRGVTITPIASRLADGRVWYLVPPVRPATPEDIDKLQTFANRVEGMPYGYAALTGTLLDLGIGSPEAWICSELGARAAQILKYIPLWLRAIRKDGLMPMQNRPAAYEPAQLARSDSYDWWNAIEIRDGVVIIVPGK